MSCNSLSCNFMSCNFMSCNLVRYFHVLQFHALQFWWSVIFTSCIFSQPVQVRSECIQNVVALFIDCLQSFFLVSAKTWYTSRPLSAAMADTVNITSSRSYFLADCTVTQYDRLLASSCRLSVCLWRCALWLSRSVYRAKSFTSVFLAGMFLFCPFRHFCCRMYRLATKSTRKNDDSKKTRTWVFLRHRKPRVHWFIEHYLLSRTWEDRHR